MAHHVRWCAAAALPESGAQLFRNSSGTLAKFAMIPPWSAICQTRGHFGGR